MGIPVNSIYNWLARYRNGGWHALRDSKKSGHPRKVTGAVLKWLYDAITGGDPRQYQVEFSLWTRRIIKTMLKRKHGIEISESSVRRIAQTLRFVSTTSCLQSLQSKSQGGERMVGEYLS